MRVSKLVSGAAALGAPAAAFAGPTIPLGQPLGLTLGEPLGNALGAVLGTFLGTPLGAIVPLAGSGVLLVGAASLAFGIFLARRKRRR